jgi:lysozyme family protein
MAKPAPSFESLRAEYARLWSTMAVDPGQAATVQRVAASIIANKKRYEQVAAMTGVPWWFIGIVHNMEAGRSFSKHLHNGDPLTARTRQVPANRPAKGEPPFTWEESAVDALEMKGLGQITDWTIERVCYEFERYNGFGYRLYHPEDKSPYLWSKSNHNDGTGKYVADGKYDPNAFSEAQCGALPTLKVMMGMDPTIRLRGRTPITDTIKVGIPSAGGAIAAGKGADEAGYSTGAQIAIGVGIFLVVAFIAVLILRRRS